MFNFHYPSVPLNCWLSDKKWQQMHKKLATIIPNNSLAEQMGEKPKINQLTPGKQSL